MPLISIITKNFSNVYCKKKLHFSPQPQNSKKYSCKKIQTKMWKKVRTTIHEDQTESVKKGWNAILSDDWSSEEDVKTTNSPREEDAVEENKRETRKERKKGTKKKHRKKMTKKTIPVSPKVQHELERWKLKGKRRAKRSEKMSLSHRLESHGTPPADMICLSCSAKLTTLNYIEYCEFGKRSWYASKSCESCVRKKLKTQWYDFNARLESTSCREVHERLLRRGPPLFIRDAQNMPCDDVENEVKVLWRGKVGRNASSIVSHAPRGENLVDWWLEKTRHVWKRPKAMYLLRSWLRRFLPQDVTTRLDMEATNYERNERQKLARSHNSKVSTSSRRCRRGPQSSSSIDANTRHRALLMVQEDRRREKKKMRELRSLVRSCHVFCVCVCVSYALYHDRYETDAIWHYARWKEIRCHQNHHHHHHHHHHHRKSSTMT